MRNATTISVIMAVYNVEKYLEASVRSVMEQTYRNLEIICVNDGSTDSSLEILRRLQKEDKRIIVINKPNGGQGDARNVGLNYATAEWISFIDSDDILRLDTYSIVAEAIKAEPDMIHFGINMQYETGISPTKSDETYYEIKHEGLVELTDSIILQADASAANKIFKKSIIDKYNIRFENILYEDFQFSTQYMLISRNTFYIKEKLYNYLRRSESTMTNTFKKSPRAIDHLYAYNYVCAFLERNGIEDAHRDIMIRLFPACYSFVIRYGSRDVIPTAVDYATRLYNKYSCLQEELKKVIKNNTVLFLPKKKTKKKRLISQLLETFFSIKKEFVNYEWSKVFRFFGVMVYKKTLD